MYFTSKSKLFTEFCLKFIDMPELVLVPLPIGDKSWPQMDTDFYRNQVRNISCWVAENARTLRRFLSSLQLGIDLPSVNIFELSRDMKPADLEQFLNENQGLDRIGVCSEAGLPCIADPGNKVVEWAQRKQWVVNPLLGPSSLMMALMGSGLNGQSFTFHGYAPLKDDGLKTWVKQLLQPPNKGYSHIFIETPYRTDRLFQWFLKNLPQEMKLCIAMDLHGDHQRIETRTLGQWKKQMPVFGKLPCVFIVGK